MTFGNLSNGTPAKLSPLLNTRGRPIKFTLERLQQIRNLVERGTSREEIAKILDVTVGSLQVTCSKVGVSLRRPKLDNGVRSPRQRNSLSSKKAIIIHNPSDHDGSVPSQPTEERSQANVQSGPAEPAPTAKPQQEPMKTREAGSANVAIRMQYRGMERTTELSLSLDVIAQLACEAEFRDMRIADCPSSKFLRQRAGQIKGGSGSFG
jgi:Helix-turn-helix domain of resolvase